VSDAGVTVDPNRVPSRTPDGTAYEVFEADGPPLLLIHGLGLSRRLWDDNLDAYLGAFHVIIYDLYGHGESAPPPGDEAASLTTYSEQIVALLDHLGIDQAIIVGFSIGGMINRRLVIDHPERVLGLCIMNSPHDRGADGQRAVEERAASVRDHGALSTMDAALKRCGCSRTVCANS